MDNNDKFLLVKLLSREFAAGRSLYETRVMIRDELPHLIPSIEMGRAIESAWKQLETMRAREEASKAEAARAVSKEARAVALYDALIALGWTPPDA